MHMWLTGSLQSPEPVEPPRARTWNAYIFPGFRLPTRIEREFLKVPAGSQDSSFPSQGCSVQRT